MCIASEGKYQSLWPKQDWNNRPFDQWLFDKIEACKSKVILCLLWTHTHTQHTNTHRHRHIALLYEAYISLQQSSPNVYNMLEAPPHYRDSSRTKEHISICIRLLACNYLSLLRKNMNNSCSWNSLSPFSSETNLDAYVEDSRLCSHFADNWEATLTLNTSKQAISS